MKNKLFISLSVGFMALIMLVAPLIFILSSAGIMRNDNLGNVIMPAKVYDDSHVFGTTLNAIEKGKAKLIDIYTNYFPGYSAIVSEVGTLKVNFNKPLYSLYSEIVINQVAPPVDTISAVDDIDGDSDTDTNTDTVPQPEEVLPEGVPEVPKVAKYFASFLKAGVYSIDIEYEDGTKTGLLTLVNTDSETKNREKVQSQVKEINRIAAANTDVNVYVYVCSRFQDGEFFSQYVPGVQSLKPFVDEFLDSLDDRIKYDKLKVDTIEDSIQKLFLTDHHWNAYGMYEAYCDIINMMSADTPSIGSPRPLGERHIIDGAAFYGSNARMYGYYNYTDTFYFYDYNLPEHEIQTTQDYRGFTQNMNRYLNGEYSQSRDADHYVNFYPYTSYTKYPENNTGRKLLLLGDSYSRGISELLCSNFDEAYVYDYRRIHEIGDYNEFIEKHGITDVLFMQYSLRGVFDGQRDNTLHLIRTK